MCSATLTWEILLFPPVHVAMDWTPCIIFTLIGVGSWDGGLNIAVVVVLQSMPNDTLSLAGPITVKVPNFLQNSWSVGWIQSDHFLELMSDG